MASTSIQTFTGKYFDYANFNEDDINEVDVAYALDKNCRFNGHCVEFYSVAKHLCLVHDLMEYGMNTLLHPLEIGHVFHGLIHDVGESVLSDIPRPLKNYFIIQKEFELFMKSYVALENKFIDLFSAKYGFGNHDEEMARIVKFYDNWALRIEQRHIMRKTTEKWDNESISFPLDPPFVKKYFKRKWYKREPNWADEFLKRLSKYVH